MKGCILFAVVSALHLQETRVFLREHKEASSHFGHLSWEFYFTTLSKDIRSNQTTSLYLLVFQKLLESIMYTVTQFLAAYKWLLRSIQWSCFVYHYCQIMPWAVSALITTGNRDVTIFN